MLVEQLNSRIQDVVNQLEHAMFLSEDARGRLEHELHGLVEQRDKAREAMSRQAPPPQPRRARHVSTWPADY